MTSPSVTNTPTLYQHTAAHTLCLATLTATASATQCSHTRLKQASIQLWRAMPSPNALPAVTMLWTLVPHALQFTPPSWASC